MYVFISFVFYCSLSFQIVGEEVISNKGFHKRVSEIVYILKEEHSIRCGQRVLIASVPNVEFYCIAVAVLAVGKLSFNVFYQYTHAYEYYAVCKLLCNRYMYSYISYEID